MDFQGFPGGSVVKNLPAKQEIWVGSLSQEDVYSLQWVGNVYWRKRRKCLLTPVFLPGKSHGQRNLAVYSPRCRKRVRHNLATKQRCEGLEEKGRGKEKGFFYCVDFMLKTKPTFWIFSSFRQYSFLERGRRKGTWACCAADTIHSSP